MGRGPRSINPETWYTRGRPVGGTSPVIFFLGTLVHACVFRTCAASTGREEAGWSRGGEGEDIRGEGWRAAAPYPYNEERGRGKKRRLICRPRTSPIRVLFVPPAIFLYPLLSGCTPELCVFPHGWGAKGWKFLGKREPG